MYHVSCIMYRVSCIIIIDTSNRYSGDEGHARRGDCVAGASGGWAAEAEVTEGGGCGVAGVPRRRRRIAHHRTPHGPWTQHGGADKPNWYPWSFLFCSLKFVAYDAFWKTRNESKQTRI